MARDNEVEIGLKIQQTLLLEQPPRDLAGIREALLDPADEHVHRADLPSYLEAHARAGAEYSQQGHPEYCTHP